MTTAHHLGPDLAVSKHNQFFKEQSGQLDPNAYAWRTLRIVYRL